MEQEPKNGVVEGVRKWLRQGGYPLEYEAEQAFREAGFDVRRGFYYDDEDEHGRPKRREIDVIALRQGIISCPLPNAEPWQVRTTLGFFIESKHVDPERSAGAQDVPGRPWVAFTSPRHSFPRPGGAVLPVASALGRYAIYSLAQNRKALRLPMFRIPDRAGYSLVSANAPKKDPGPTYSSLQASTKAAYSWMPKPSSIAFPAELFIGFPVVATDNNLVECWFAERTCEEKLDDPLAREEIEPREEVRLYWHGSTLIPDYIAVDVITRPTLEKYARRMFDGCEKLIELLQECVPLWATEIMVAELGEFNRRLQEMERDWP